VLTGLGTRIVNRRVPFLIVGVMCAVLGIILVSASTVTCGKDTMQEGDVCLITGEDGSPVKTTYEQEKRGAERGGRALIGLGIVGLLVAGGGFVVAVSKGRREGREERARRDEWTRRYGQGRGDEPGDPN
jgi:hypothetical protein